MHSISGITARASRRPDEDPSQALRLSVIRCSAILFVTIGCTVVVATGWTSFVRVVLSLAFLFFGPGLAFTELVEIEDLTQKLAIAPAASLAAGTLVALALIYAGAFSVLLTVGILAGLTVALLFFALGRAVRRARRRNALNRSQA
jgi:uncharacterized membrane protein